MDPRARATTWDLVRSLREDGTTIVLTTHHMDEAEQLCDHLAIIDHGRIVREGTPEDITSLGGHDLRFSTAAGLDLPALAAALSLAADAVGEHRPGDYMIRATMTPELVADLAVWLRDKGFGLRSCAPGGQRSKRSSSR